MEPTSNKVDLEDDNVIQTSWSAAGIRAWLDGEDAPEQIVIALDEAQAKVYVDELREVFVVIRVAP